MNYLRATSQQDTFIYPQRDAMSMEMEIHPGLSLCMISRLSKTRTKTPLKSIP